MAGDVWAGPEAGDGGAPEAVGEGLHPNQAYSIDAVLGYGVAFVQEAPTYAFAGAGAIAVVQLIPSVFSFASNFVQGMANGDPGLLVVAMGLNVVQLAATLIGIPLSVLLRGGLGTMAAKHARGEALDLGDVYRHVVPAVRLGVYTIAVSVITFLALLVVVVPTMGAVFGAAWAFAGDDVPTLVGAVSLGLLAVVLPAVVIVSLAVGLATFAGNAAAIDEHWPVEALRRAFAIGRAAPITLLVTTFALGLANLLAFLSVFCVVGLVAVPAVIAVTEAGMMIAYLTTTRPAAELERSEFFKRHPLPL